MCLTMKQKNSILSIDRGKKYVWCAYALQGSSIVFPIGYIINDKTLFASLHDIISRYRVKTIIVGMPRDVWAREQIEKFMHEFVGTIADDIEVDAFDEDYTSVQAWEKIGNFEKNIAEDTLAAMLILERWIAHQPSSGV